MLKYAAIVAFALTATSVSAKPPTVFAKNSERAATMNVDDPETRICVRRPMTNSRTRFTKQCLTQDQWKSVKLEKDAQAQDMKAAARGVTIQ